MPLLARRLFWRNLEPKWPLWPFWISYFLAFLLLRTPPTMFGINNRSAERKKKRGDAKQSSGTKEAGVFMTQHKKRPVESGGREECRFLDISDRLLFPLLPTPPPPEKDSNAASLSCVALSFSLLSIPSRAPAALPFFWKNRLFRPNTVVAHSMRYFIQLFEIAGNCSENHGK